MILLVTPTTRARDCAKPLEEAIGDKIQVATTLRDALGDLRAREYTAVVIDQSLLETDPDECEIVLQHVGMAIPVQINFAISGVERVVRELRAALRRRSQEVLLARQGAQQALRSELKGTATALLLSCEMALRIPNLESSAAGKMRTVYELAQEMCAKLETLP